MGPRESPTITNEMVRLVSELMLNNESMSEEKRQKMLIQVNIIVIVKYKNV